MITLYLWDARGIYSRSMEVDAADAMPHRSTPMAPPADIAPGHVALWVGGDWAVGPMPQQILEPVPASCTRRQGQLVLLSHGLLDDAEAAIAAITDPTERRAAQIEYDADTWERSNAFLSGLWAQLGGTPESLDEAFRVAVTL